MNSKNLFNYSETQKLDGRYVFVPDSSHGSGHFIRCARLAKQLGGCIFVTPGFIRHYFDFEISEAREDDTQARIHEAIQQILQVDLPKVYFIWKRGQLQDISIEKLVFDLMKLDVDELMSWKAKMKIGLDVEGSGKEYLDYTIDMLHVGQSKANIADASYLFLPSARRPAWPTRIQRVLLIFGSRDRTKKAVLLRNILAKYFPGIHFFSGLEKAESGKAGWNTAEYFYNYDLIITHYGVTMNEALWARVPVLLINPTRYHQRLSQKKMLQGTYWNQAQGNYKTIVELFEKTLRDFHHLLRRCVAAAPQDSKSLPGLLDSLALPKLDSKEPVHTRLDRQSVIKRKAGMYTVQRFSKDMIRYDKSYFNEEYKKQYGKSYIEDFENLYALGTERLSVIQNYVDSGLLLDIGCAYGHFLKAAADRGFEAKGVEISEDAVQYAQKTAGLAVTRFNIETEELDGVGDPESFDVITMWYILEHFATPLSVLEKIIPYLRWGGIFAFSAPSAAGISARKNLKQFFQNSPSDHYTHFNPWSLRRVFAKLPLRLLAWRSTGHHPERIHPSLNQKQEIKVFVEMISKAIRLGDTFEAYFKKG